MIIRPFRALTPAPEFAADVACVPYDVVDRDEAYALAANNSSSLLHVDRAEIDVPADVNPYSDSVYAKAAENFVALQQRNVLLREDKPLYFLYGQTMGAHRQIGIAATVRAVDYEKGLVKKHEKTRPEKENDRTRLIDEIGAQTGPILLAYRGTSALNALVQTLAATTPDYDFLAPDGIRHTLWKVRDTPPLKEAFGEVPAVYIADGHHRAASGARVAGLRRERLGFAPGAEVSSEEILGVLFPADQLQVLAYNRVVKDLNGHTPAGLLAAISEIFHVTSPAPDRPDSQRKICMYLDGSWHQLSWSEDPAADAVSRLDVSVLQERILGPLLGIDDPRTNARIEFVGGIRGTEELVRKVNSGLGAIAFSMYPTTVDQVMDIADAGQIMPPKSTWFEPKLRSGLFIHVLD